MLTQKTLTEALDYNKVTGLFTWKSRPPSHFFQSKKRTSTNISNNWNSRHSGRIAGSINCCGYVGINIFGSIIGAHRLAFLYVEGILPSKSVDHLDGNESNNSYSNLSIAGQLLNGKNCKRSKNNSSGFNGVYQNANKKKWVVKIKVNYKSITVGTFDTIEQAVSARIHANITHGFTERHGKTL